MIYTIVPARDEGRRIDKTLDMLLKTKTDRILVLINGSMDNTLEKVSNIDNDRILVYCFNKALGLDIPRAIGAYFAYNLGATGFIFVDGDMMGNIASNIDEIINDLSYNNIDLALTDCYHQTNGNSHMAKVQLSFRRQLNLELGVYDKIRYATPSHGPHGISKELIDKIGFKNLAIPPTVLALAVKNNLNIKVTTKIPDYMLQSTIKDEFHALQIAKTIIGDCIEASSLYRGNTNQRGFDGKTFLGYHKNRRFDILKLVIDSLG
jgi:glycosyltransferase involved in cell wall biosynthesis